MQIYDRCMTEFVRFICHVPERSVSIYFYLICETEKRFCFEKKTVKNVVVLIHVYSRALEGYSVQYFYDRISQR